MQAVAGRAGDDEAAVRDGHGYGAERAVGVARRHAVQVVAGAPHLGAHERQGHPHERVTEMGEHDVGAVARDVVVEGDRSPLVRAGGVLEADRRARPARRQRRDDPRAGLGTWGQRRLSRERERRGDDAMHALGLQVQRDAALVQVVAQRGEALAHAALGVQQRARRGGATAQARLVEGGAAAEHRLLDLRGDHRAGAAEVLADLLDLRHDAREEVEVAFERAALRGLPAGAHAVMDEHLRGGLAMAVDAAVALLQAVGVPRDLGVGEQVAVALQRDPLGRGVRRQQHADGVVGGRLLPLALDALALVAVGRAVEQLDALAGDAAGREALLQVALGGAVLGEDDDALGAEPAAGPDARLDPVQQRARAGVLGDGGPGGPARHRVEDAQLFGGRAALLGGGGGLDRLARRLADAVVACLLVVGVGGVVEESLQDVRGRRRRRAAVAQQRLAMNRERALERGR